MRLRSGPYSRLDPPPIILFVDDDAKRRAILIAALRGRRYWPIAAAHADEARLVLGSIRPSFVAVVLGGPEVDPLLSYLRADRLLRQVPTLAFRSAAAMATDLVPALDALVPR
jgi:DNA-binding response OmpR family regulator